jgi:hypothetical protein
MTYNGTNMGYWLMNRLGEDYLKVLRRIEKGHQEFFEDRFSVAYLISQECVAADMEKETLSITEKGRDALEFFAGES